MIKHRKKTVDEVGVNKIGVDKLGQINGLMEGEKDEPIVKTG